MADFFVRGGWLKERPFLNDRFKYSQGLRRPRRCRNRPKLRQKTSAMKKALRKTLVAPWEVGMERPRSHIEPGIPASEKQPKSAAHGPQSYTVSLRCRRPTLPFPLLRHISQLLLSKFKGAQEQRRPQAFHVMLFLRQTVHHHQSVNLVLNSK